MKGLRIGRRRARTHEQTSSPLELALRPALVDGRWAVPDRFNFTRDVVEVLAADPKRRALTFIGADGVIEPRTFFELAEAAAWWAATLSEHGVQPKDRVLVLAESSVDWVELVLGVMKVGAVTVPCRPSLSASALEARVSSIDASLVVAEQVCQPAIEQMSFSPDVHYLEQGVRHAAADVPTDSPTHDTSTRDLAFVFTTAGAADAPKEIAHTHGAVFAARAQAELWLDVGARDVVWCTAEADSPLHAWFTLVGPWSRGAEIVLHRGEFDPHERLEHLYRLAPTIVCQSAGEYRALVGVPRLERYRTPRLRRLVSTGDLLEPEVRDTFEQRWELPIQDGYGQAETGIVIASSAEDAKVVGAIGRPLPGYEVAVVDDHGDELPPGIEGDLVVRGGPPTLFAGYWEAADETKRAYRGDWYLTGDVAMTDEEGMFVFLGRAEDIITSSGRTFGPYGIEHVLRSHDAIAQSAVVGVRDLQRGGQFIRAYVVLVPRARESEQLEAELRQHVGQVLSEQQIPREIVFVQSLPLIDGKVSRRTLREQPLSGRPLWDTPSAEPDEASAREPARTVSTELPKSAPLLTPSPPPEPVWQPSLVVEPKPVPVAEPEPVAFVEPEPSQIAPESPPFVQLPEPVTEIQHASEPLVAPMAAPEPTPVVEPEPTPVVEPEPTPVVEPEPAPEPAPVAFVEPEPMAAPEPEPVAFVEPEPVAAPEPTPMVEPEPAAEPDPEAVAKTAQEPVAPPEPDAEQRAEFRVVAPPEPEPPQDPAPLPDFVVPPDPDAAKAPTIAPEVEPEPPSTLDLLPDYIVDPSRPHEPRVDEEAGRQAARADRPAFPGLVPPPEPEPSAAEAAGIYFPPVTSFPSPRDGEGPSADGDPEARKAPRRRPAADTSKTKKKRSLEEPGDDAGAEWMAGLSNRLSAYSLAEEGSEEAGERTGEDAERNGS